jgi:DNA polymerase III delta prime subunit
MIHRVSLKAQGGRVVLIKGAHLLSHEAVNAMLKTIEESSTGTIFIFTTRNKNGIMPTIISRCQGYYFPEKDFSVHENQALEFLQSDLIHRFDFVKKISNSRLKAAKFLDDLQRYLRNQLRNNNSLRKTEIARGIRLAGHSQDLLKMNVSAKLILENLSLKIKKRRLENN